MEYIGRGFEELSEENIFKKVTEYDLFNYYIPDFEAINKVFCSPLRDDRKPSCSIQEWEGKLFYKDFGTGDSYDIISFIKAKFNISYYEVLNIISADFNLGLHSKTIEANSMGYIGLPNVEKKVVEKSSVIRIKRRDWNSIDKKYWESYGLNRSILRHFNVVPLSHIWVNDICIIRKANNPSYAYILDEGIYKILSPYDNKYKWINNCNNSHLQGYNQLVDKGELLIITSSLKDVMVLYNFGYNAIAPMSENTLIDMTIMTNLKERFTTIVIFFDNDTAGIESSKVYKELYGINNIIIPLGEVKDISDYYKKYGNNSTKTLLNKLIWI